jgi:two-component system sensor histidine kinase BaeS
MLLQSRIEAMQDGIVPFDASGLATLHTETLRLSRLIGQIELLAEAEAQPPPLRSDELALDSLAKELHDDLAPAFEVRGLELEVQAAHVVAHADRDAVRQIAMNLLSNALKYAPDGDRVLLSTTREGDTAALRVQNVSGRVPPAERGRVFERFYRGSAALGATSGAGLGLAIARELAEAQGGSLELEEAPGGASFVLRLPTSPRRRDPAAPGGSRRRHLRAPRA